MEPCLLQRDFSTTGYCRPLGNIELEEVQGRPITPGRLQEIEKSLYPLHFALELDENRASLYDTESTKAPCRGAHPLLVPHFKEDVQSLHEG